MQAEKEQRVERRLAAIFAADVAAYSRLMSQDEAATLRARPRLAPPLIEQFKTLCPTAAKRMEIE